MKGHATDKSEETARTLNRALRIAVEGLEKAKVQLKQEKKLRQKSEKELARLNAIIRDTAQETYTIDLDSLKFVRANRKALTNSRYSAEQLREMTPLELHHNLDPKLFHTMVETLRAGEETRFRYESVYKRADGSLYPVEEILQLFSHESGSVLVAIAQDISRKKKAESLLKASKKRYEAVVELMPNALVTIDEHGIIQTFNKSAEKIFGYSREEVVGENVSILMPEPHRSMHNGYLATFRETGNTRVMGEPRDSGFFGCRKDGSIFPISLLVESFKADDAVFFGGIIQDLSEKYEVESLNRRLRMVVAQTTNAIIILNADHSLDYANEAAKRDLGWTEKVRDNIPKELDHRLFSAETLNEMYEELDKTGSWSGRISVQSTRGDLLHFDASGFVIKDDIGTITHYVITGKNITDQLKLEEKLVQARKLESIGQLAAGIAHEINTPSQYVGDNIRFLRESFDELHAMMLKLEGLLESKDDTFSRQDIQRLLEGLDVEFIREEVPSAIGQSLSGIERISKIVRAMKEFSHPAQEMTQVDLNSAIESTITVASNEWKYIAEMKTDFDPGMVSIPCLPGEFNQVILNMIVNAAHAIDEATGPDSDERGTITVNTKLLDDCAEVRIADTGAGIPEDIKHRIFDPFFTTKEVGKGTGQGLSIAYSIIVEKLGGTLEVESEPGKGTCFVIHVPREAQQEAGETQAA